MNLFVLDTNPKLAAQYLCDKHVNKMLLETCQLLYGAHWINNEARPSGPNNNPYKLTHKNHPVSIWVRKAKGNYVWAAEYGINLIEEVEFRFNNKTHKCFPHARWLRENLPVFDQPNQTPFAQAMPEKYRNENAVLAYRKYYMEDKPFAKWEKNRPKPWWLNEFNC